jgi:hypothetical protein
MEIQDLIAYIKQLVNYDYFAYTFPLENYDNSAVVVIGSGMPLEKDTGVKRPSIQILVRGKDIQLVGQKANELFKALANKREIAIGAASVVQITANGSAPIFIGTDENNRPTFSMNFIAVIRP